MTVTRVRSKLLRVTFNLPPAHGRRIVIILRRRNASSVWWQHQKELGRVSRFCVARPFFFFLPVGWVRVVRAALQNSHWGMLALTAGW